MSSLSPRSNRYHHHQQQHSSSAFEMHERIETRTSTRHEHFEHAAGATVLRRLAAGSIIDLSDTRAPTLPPITAPINGHGATPIAGHVNRAATTRMMFLGTSLLTSHVDGTLALYTRQSTAPTSLALSNGVAAHTHSILWYVTLLSSIRSLDSLEGSSRQRHLASILIMGRDLAYADGNDNNDSNHLFVNQPINHECCGDDADDD